MNKNLKTTIEVLSGTINDNEYAPFYQTYIKLSRGQNLFKRFIDGKNTFLSTIKKINDEDALFRYANDKWSMKEVIGHMIDTERVMAFRALTFAREEQAELPGYDQDEYVAAANFDELSMEFLLKDYQTVRDSTLNLFESFTPQILMRNGVANDCIFSVRALGYVIAGHELHHLNIIKEKYMPGLA